MLALEDLHWVDATSAEFFTFLLDHLAGTRVLLVCTYRPDFVSTWSRKSYHSVLTLTPLGHPDGRQMLTAVLGTAHIQDELATLVLDKAEGIPFFLEELVHALQETGAIELHAGQWRLTPGSTGVSVPIRWKKCSWPALIGCPKGPNWCCRSVPSLAENLVGTAAGGSGSRSRNSRPISPP